MTPSTGKADISDKTHCCAQNISAFFSAKDELRDNIHCFLLAECFLRAVVNCSVVF